jgi:hypothetical protein
MSPVRPGEPSFWAEPTEEAIRAAVEAVDERELLETFWFAWESRGLAPPEWTAGEVREAVVQAYAGLPEVREPRELLLGLREAARALGLSYDELRHALEAGDEPEFEEARRTRRSGETALAFRPPASEWRLMPLRPDPRLVMARRVEEESSRLVRSRRNGRTNRRRSA